MHSVKAVLIKKEALKLKMFESLAFSCFYPIILNDKNEALA